jgi:cell division protein FtsQ
MARKKKTRKVADGPDPKAALKWVLRLLPAAVLLIALTVLFQRVEDLLIDDSRFQLGAAEEYGDTSPDISVSGLENASRDRVMRVFAEDTGRSLYLFPEDERRRRLLAINWIKDAAVARIWPNRVEVHVRERDPVAFVQLKSRGARTRVALIDEDGVILDPPQKSEYDLPVLRGVSEEQSESMRAVRVKRAMELMRDVGPLGEQVSEIDVSEPNNLKVSQSAGGNAVTLIVGRERYRSRIENFLAHYPEIQRRLPGASTFDLRLDDRITAVNGVGGGS